MSMANEDIVQDNSLAERALPVGTVLSGGQFTITDQLGAGGFGITYRAMDNVLGRTVVIKECFPEDFCVRHGLNAIARSETYEKPVRSIVRMFMREAQSLAKLRHPNIVGVHNAFEENETAYMALDLIDGRDLFDILEVDADALSPARIKSILLQLLDAIEEVHKLDLLHRDISPDNVIIEKNGTPVLIDFGAARGDASRRTRAVSSLLVVKDGYSPQEFYAVGSAQSPSSDLYALAATFYHVLNGAAPVDSQTRMIEIVGNRPDPCVPLAGRIQGYEPEFLQAIDTAMQIHPQDRLQSAGKWKALLADVETDTRPTSKPRNGVVPTDISMELEMSLTRLVEETNDEVRKTTQLKIEEDKTPVADAPKAPPKPDWITEFNQESLSPAKRLLSKKDGLDDEEFDALDDAVPGDLGEITPSETAEISANASETNWIDRAKEKQERIRSEQEREYALVEVGETGRATSKPISQGPTLPGDPPDIAAAADIAPKEDIKSIRFLVVLLICFVFAAIYQLK